MAHLKTLSTLVLSASLAGCLGLNDSNSSSDTASDDGGAIALPNTAISAALDYIDESLPEYGSAGSVAYLGSDLQRFFIRSARSLSPISMAYAAASASAGTSINTAWDGSGDSNLIAPPGGHPQDGEVVPGTSDPLDYITMKEYLGYQLRSDFSRESGDGGPYKPTLFGRFDSAISIVNILAELLPDGIVPGTSTVYITMDEEGNPVAAAETDEGAAPITLSVVDISADNDLYDVAIRVVSTAIDLDVRLWLTNTSSTLNFQQLEYQQVNNDDDGSIPIDAGDITRTSITTLNWNRTTGEMLFEYVSIDDDDNTTANGSVMRFYVAEEGGDAYLVAFEGDTAGDGSHNQYKAFSIATTGGDAATEALVSVNMQTSAKDDSDYHVSGSDFCVSMENGDAITGCTGLDGSALAMDTDFPAFISNVVAMNNADEVLEYLGLAAWTDITEPNLGSAPGYTGASDIGDGFAAPDI
jgi:hypothetical protein